jgi:hypothetical protein
MIITHIDDDYNNICLNQLALLQNSIEHKVHPSNEHNALSSEHIWWSGNMMEYFKDLNIDFKKTTEFLKGLAETFFHCRLKYHYLHLIDYKNSGSMGFHNHKHAENIVYILYLNDCFDGSTNFYLKDIVSLTPKKSQIVFFESYIDHSGSFSQNKQILVGGLKKYQN